MIILKKLLGFEEDINNIDDAERIFRSISNNFDKEINEITINDKTKYSIVNIYYFFIIIKSIFMSGIRNYEMLIILNEELNNNIFIVDRMFMFLDHYFLR